MPPTLPTTAPAIVAVAGLFSPTFDALVLFAEEPVADGSILIAPGERLDVVTDVDESAGNNALDEILSETLLVASAPEGEAVGVGKSTELVVDGCDSAVGSDELDVDIEGAGLGGGEESFESLWMVPGSLIKVSCCTGAGVLSATFVTVVGLPSDR
jgi:hypothetical protein